MSMYERVFLGTLAGLMAVLCKFMAQDYPFLSRHASDVTAEQILNYQVGYGILTPILMILGGFIAWISDEHKRMKIAALAISAPALITTWAGGGDPGAKVHARSASFISSAYAQQAPAGRPSPQTTQSIGALDRVQQGVGIFFGYGKEPVKYRVVVGSYADREAAQKFAAQLNAQTQKSGTLPPAWVAERKPNNPHYPVVLGDYTYLSKATAIKDEALKVKGVSAAYLSAEAAE
jgi:hypothetical protein